jgi:putative ABC transport system permease protein
MSQFVFDVRYACRGLARAPGFAAAAILTVALGMGATTAIFSVVRSVLLAPLPYAHPDRRVTLWTRWTAFDKTWLADAEVDDFRRLCPSLASVAAWDSGRANLTSMSVNGDAEGSSGGDPVRIGVGRIEWNGFETLGARPLLGRGFTADEDRPGGAPVAVLGWAVWQSRYGADPRVLERSIRLDGVVRRVVGVMPRGFALPTDFTADASEPTSIWIPLQLDPKERTHDSHNYFAAAALRPGATVERATAEMKSVMANLTRQGVYPAVKRMEAFAVPVEQEIRGSTRRALVLVFGAVGFLMVMACANVANLLLARAEGRQREISIRAAIGAGRGRLVRQLLTESLVLASLAGVVGIGLAWVGIRAVAARGSAGLPALAPIALDVRMVAFAAVLTLATTLLFGLAPALTTLRLDLNQSLRDSSAGSSAGLRGHTMRRTLAAAQMALAVVLLLGAGLMVRTLDALTRIDLGFDPRHVLTLRLRPDEVAYAKAEAVTAVYRSILGRVREIPGVRAAGVVRSLPLAASIGDRGLLVEGYVPPPGTNAKGDWQVVSDGALEALGERVVAGRAFTSADSESSQPVAIVNQTFVRTYWPDGRALGRRIRMGSDKSGRPLLTVVGVVRDERHNGLTGIIKEKFYVPHAQFSLSTGSTPRDMTLVVRADGDPAGAPFVASVRAAIRAVDPGLPVADVRSMEAVVGASMATPRLTASLLSIFASIALVLASVGVAGVLAFLVSRRRREIGIRMALGATRAGVVALVLRRGLAWAGAGIAAGLAASLFLTRLMAGLLYGVAPRDPRTFLSVAALLTGVAVLASAVPALRASRVDPLEALRTE